MMDLFLGHHNNNARKLCLSQFFYPLFVQKSLNDIKQIKCYFGVTADPSISLYAFRCSSAYFLFHFVISLSQVKSKIIPIYSKRNIFPLSQLTYYAVHTQPF